MRRDPTGVLQHTCKMQQIPRHKNRIAVSEIIFGRARSGVEI